MSGAEERELLEWAAKAAGIEHEGEAGSWLAGKGNPALLLAGTEKVWNPRRDDGDSRRLEVALKIDVTHYYPSDVCAFGHGEPFSEDYGDDPAAATRLAVLRAAAAIGKAMT